MDSPAEGGDPPDSAPDDLSDAGGSISEKPPSDPAESSKLVLLLPRLWIGVSLEDLRRLLRPPPPPLCGLPPRVLAVLFMVAVAMSPAKESSGPVELAVSLGATSISSTSYLRWRDLDRDRPLLGVALPPRFLPPLRLGEAAAPRFFFAAAAFFGEDAAAAGGPFRTELSSACVSDSRSAYSAFQPGVWRDMLHTRGRGRGGARVDSRRASETEEEGEQRSQFMTRAGSPVGRPAVRGGRRKRERERVREGTLVVHSGAKKAPSRTK